MDRYITCQKCGELAYYENEKYFCKKCGQKVKLKPIVGWGNKNYGGAR